MKTKIFFTASYFGKKKYQRYYDLVLRKIEECDVELIGTEKGNYMDILDRRMKRRLKNERYRHYEAIRKGILWADAVIIEISNEDFQLGHEASLAMLSKKHVLCLSLHEDFSKKILNEYFHGAKYNEYNIGTVIRDFIKVVQKERLSERFNCFLSKKQVTHLNRKASLEGINRSEFLRRLLEDDMRGFDLRKGSE